VLTVADDVPDERLRALGVHGLGGAHDLRVVAVLAGPDGWIDSLDALLVARGRGGGGPLVERPGLRTHPRSHRPVTHRVARAVVGSSLRGAAGRRSPVTAATTASAMSTAATA
jgi:hypothetical protein